MNNSEFISFIDEQIKQEILLGTFGYSHRLIGLRNIKSDFNYIASITNSEAIDILRKLYKERKENELIYQDTEKTDLWLQEHVEAEILSKWLPKEPEREDIIDFLSSLDIPKRKSEIKNFQSACIKKFGQKIDTNIILDFINRT